MAKSTARRTRRRSAGEGSVYEAADGRWRGAVTWTEPDGRRSRRIVSAPTSALARDKLDDLRRELRLGTIVPPGRTVTVGEYLGAWIEGDRTRVRPSTWRGRVSSVSFRDAGFPDEQAADAYFAFGNYVMGSVAQDTAGARLAPRSASGEAPAGGSARAYIQQLPADQFPNIRALAPLIYGPSDRAAEPDPGSRLDASSRRFDFGLDSLLDGLAARLDR